MREVYKKHGYLVNPRRHAKKKRKKKNLMYHEMLFSVLFYSLAPFYSKALHMCMLQWKIYFYVVVYFFVEFPFSYAISNAFL